MSLWVINLGPCIVSGEQEHTFPLHVYFPRGRVSRLSFLSSFLNVYVPKVLRTTDLAQQSKFLD